MASQGGLESSHMTDLIFKKPDAEYCRRPVRPNPKYKRLWRAYVMADFCPCGEFDYFRNEAILDRAYARALKKAVHARKTHNGVEE